MSTNQKKDAAAPNLQTIYSNCLDLFQSKQITSYNAFTCKLLDCLPQIIESPEFDIGNMQVVGRTLEMGTKIYVCRVDHTYNMVMDLARRVGDRGKAREKLREIAEQQRQAEEDAEDAEEAMELGDNELDDNGEPLYAKERKPREKKKRQGHYVSAKDKIRIVFSEKLEQYADRQKRVKDILNKFKETRQNIPQEEFEVRGRVQEEAAAMKDTAEQLATVHKFPQAFIKAEFGSCIQFLQFVWFPNNVQFDPNLHDTWGRPKPVAGAPEEGRNSIGGSAPPPGADDVMAVNVQGEYLFDALADVDYGGADEGMVDAERFGYDGDSDHEEDRDAAFADLGQVRNMSQLAEFYQALRTMGANKKMACSWAGPNFLRPRGAAASRPGTANSEKRTRTKKEAKPFEFGKIDWRDPVNQYDPVSIEKIETDDKSLERWRTTKNTVAFVEFTSDEAEVDYNSEAYSEGYECSAQDKDEDVERILRYFVDRKRNILQMFGEHYKKDLGMNVEQAMDDGDINFDEAPRSQFEDGEDYCSKSMIEAEFPDNPAEETPLIGNKRLHSFLSFFPTMTNSGNTDDYDDFMGATVDSEGVKFAKQPKPINMKLLKLTIIRVLKEKLELDDEYQSTQDEDMSTDMLTIIAEVFKKVDERTAKFLSTSLLFVALLHVAVELRLFLEKTEGAIENLNIVARSKTWEHRLHIPMPEITGSDHFALPELPPATPAVAIMERDNEKENQVEPMNLGDETVKSIEDDDDEDVFMRPQVRNV